MEKRYDSKHRRFVQENLREQMDIIHIVGLPDQGKETV